MADITIRPQGADRGTEINLDDGNLYLFNWVETDWGSATQPEPQETQTLGGAALFLPGKQNWIRRTIKISGAVICNSLNDKLYRLSELTQRILGAKTLFRHGFEGERTVRRHAWEIDVFFSAPVEVGDSKRTPNLLQWEATGYATPPFWRMASTLATIQYDETLYPDYGVPYAESQPPYLFGCNLTGAEAISQNPVDGPHFIINNWGTAYCHPTATLTNVPDGDLYLKGVTDKRVRLKVVNGTAALTPSERFYLAPGDNGIRFEDAIGDPYSLNSNTTIDFGATALRYL